MLIKILTKLLVNIPIGYIYFLNQVLFENYVFLYIRFAEKWRAKKKRSSKLSTSNRTIQVEN